VRDRRAGRRDSRRLLAGFGLRQLGLRVSVALAAAAIGGAIGVVTRHHPAARVAPLRPPIAIHGYAIAQPAFALSTSDPRRIGSFTFLISPADSRTVVRAGLEPGVLADACGVGRVKRRVASVTCAYFDGKPPTVRSATELTVDAAN
jgi:antitoxin (DNA-binding transcriptional repressor) of toxin-antitoxin stability system